MNEIPPRRPTTPEEWLRFLRENDRQEAQAEFEERSRHLVYLLTQEGVSRETLTLLKAAAERFPRHLAKEIDTILTK